MYALQPNFRWPQLFPSPSYASTLPMLHSKSSTGPVRMSAAKTGRVAVITGTARPAGIGRACLKAFLKAGYRAIGLDAVEHEAQQDLQQAIQSHQLVLHKADIADTDQVNEQWQGLNIGALINNAGVANPYLPTDSAQDRMQQWQKVISTNLSGAFVMSEACLPFMEADSSIIHVSSTRAKQSEPHSEAYGAAKAGLVGLTHAQAVSLGPKVRVNAVLPGWIETTGEPDSISEEEHKWQPTGRVGTSEDVAELCLFLADPQKAAFITGQEFVIDGGVSKKMVYPE